MSDNPPHLPAGPATDRRVAEQIMRWGFKPPNLIIGPNAEVRVLREEGEIGDSDDFRPSTNIAHAWEVITRLRSIGYDVEITSRYPNAWAVIIRSGGQRITGDLDVSAPLAICRAALAATPPVGGR